MISYLTFIQWLAPPVQIQRAIAYKAKLVICEPSIEEMFGDMKKHGFDLESTRLRKFSRLSRLTLAVVWVYVWLVSIGGRTIHRGFRHLVDRNDRRDLSIFQIGFRFIQRRLINVLPVHVSLCTYR
jgi:hypothetical protein